jgi:hypothetical protein
VTESFSASCRRVLQSDSVLPEDYEAARYLIDQGLAAGQYGPPSKSRDHYGKITQLVWFGITPAGRLWLEESARAELEKTQKIAQQENDQKRDHLQEHVRTVLVEAIREASPPPSNLVRLAWTVGAGAILLAVGYLVRTHLGIPL